MSYERATVIREVKQYSTFGLLPLTEAPFTMPDGVDFSSHAHCLCHVRGKVHVRASMQLH